MRKYLITITMPDGSQGRHVDYYDDGFHAAIVAITAFPNAMRVSARRLA